MNLPQSLARFTDTDEGRAWIETLPDALAACSARWGLELQKPYPDSYVSLVLPARRADGSAAVLKIQFPDRESRGEADALQLWDGNGAVFLLDREPDYHALLLERCLPGRYLSRAGPETSLAVLIGLLPRLWVPAEAPFNTLSDEVARWVANLPIVWQGAGEPFAESLLDEIVAMLTELASTQGEQVLLHQDLHGDNVLSAQREPWLVIDPKPLIGEREFALSPIIRSGELGHSREHVLYRLDRLSGELGLNRDRARLWAAGQAIAWGFEGGEVLPGHIETARWLLSG